MRGSTLCVAPDQIAFASILQKLMTTFLDRDLALENYWRSIILFGQNVASYKFALAKSPIGLSGAGTTSMILEQPAEPFLCSLVEHLSNAPKQATSVSSRFLDSCKRFRAGKVTKEELIGQTVRLGFQNVIDAFHSVNRDEIPVRFCQDDRKNGGGIVLTDDFFRLRDQLQFGNRTRRWPHSPDTPS